MVGDFNQSFGTVEVLVGKYGVFFLGGHPHLHPLSSNPTLISVTFKKKKGK
jgi:hypothetical protein